MNAASAGLIALVLCVPGCDQVFGLHRPPSDAVGGPNDVDPSGTIGFVSAVSFATGSAQTLHYSVAVPAGLNRVVLVSVMVGGGCSDGTADDASSIVT